jgi:hypothetical protein
MRKFVVSLLICLPLGSLQAQNSFPSSGNAEIYQRGTSARAYDVYNANGLLVSRFEVTSDKSGQLWLKDVNGNTRVILRSNSSPSYIMGNLGLGTSTPDAALDIKKEGIALEIDHTTKGGHSLIKFNSVVNNGSDKAFILFQDESSNSPGSGSEDVRLTMGVFNDFRASSYHSDELWLQGGGRLVQNVGSWDEELNTIIGTPSTGTTGGYEWRVNNSVKMGLSHAGQLSVSGTILAKEVKVSTDASNWPDYVFDDNYNLQKLSKVEDFINIHKHLPHMPSAAEVEEDGINLAEMNKLLLMKVEELTLYVIDKDKEVCELRKCLEEKTEQLKRVESRLENIENLISK